MALTPKLKLLCALLLLLAEPSLAGIAAEKMSAVIHGAPMLNKATDPQYIAGEADAAVRFTQRQLHGTDASSLGQEAASLEADLGQGTHRAQLRTEMSRVGQEINRLEVAAATQGSSSGASETQLQALRQRIEELQSRLSDQGGQVPPHVRVETHVTSPHYPPPTYSVKDTSIHYPTEPYYAVRTQTVHYGGSGAMDINTDTVPYPDAPFGRVGTAKTLTESSVAEGDAMVHRIEGAQSSESKRAVFRALTRLRGLTVASYDGIATGHLANVDEYSHAHHWRSEHHIRHLAEEEADVSRWAFPVDGRARVAATSSTYAATTTPAAQDGGNSGGSTGGGAGNSAGSSGGGSSQGGGNSGGSTDGGAGNSGGSSGGGSSQDGAAAPAATVARAPAAAAAPA